MLGRLHCGRVRFFFLWFYVGIDAEKSDVISVL